MNIRRVKLFDKGDYLMAVSQEIKRTKHNKKKIMISCILKLKLINNKIH